MLPIRAMAALTLGAAMLFQSWGFILPHQNPTDTLILVNKQNKAPAVPPTLVLPDVPPTKESIAGNIFIYALPQSFALQNARNTLSPTSPLFSGWN